MKAEVLLIVLPVLMVRSLERNDSCVTPNKEKSTCVSFLNCEPIQKALRTKDEDAVEFALRSQCGFDSEPLVCCGAHGHKLLTYEDAFREAHGNPVDTRTEPSHHINGFSDVFPDESTCGVERDDVRIFGGTETEPNEFPWMVALEYKSKHNGKSMGIRCGGSLINTRYVLTAAHCIVHQHLQLARAWLGEWNITSDPDCRKVGSHFECADKVLKLHIEKETPHPSYTLRGRNNDIGLLRLERDVKYTDYIHPVCLPLSGLPQPRFGTNMVIAGWGATEYGSLSDVKLKVSVPLVSKHHCDSVNLVISDGQICAGGEKGKDSCKGDSGGPLMRIFEDYSKRAQWYQEGVVSYGVGCGAEGYPAVYTNVRNYITWIERTLRNG